MALNDDAYQLAILLYCKKHLTTKGFVGKNFYANHGGAVFNGQNMQNFLQQHFKY